MFYIYKAIWEVGIANCKKRPSRFIKRQKPGHSKKKESPLTPEYILNHSSDVKSDLVLLILLWERMHKLHNTAV